MQTQTVNLSIPRVLLQAVNYQAQSEARTRSGLIQEAIRVYLARRVAWGQVFEYGKKQAMKAKARPRDLEKVIDGYRVGR